MKKILALLLASVMVIAMCACAKEEPVENTETVANPVHECTKQEMIDATGMDIDAPAGAEDVEYFYIDGETPIAQVEFELNDEEFCYRAQSTAITSLSAEIKDNESVAEEKLKESLDKAIETGVALSGLNYTWDVAALVDVPAGREGVYAIHDNDEGFIAWLDVVPGILYSLSIDDDATIDLLMNTAEAIFVPMQGEVG